jgi:hypothetical protein
MQNAGILRFAQNDKLFESCLGVDGSRAGNGQDNRRIKWVVLAEGDNGIRAESSRCPLRHVRKDKDEIQGSFPFAALEGQDDDFKK